MKFIVILLFPSLGVMSAPTHEYQSDQNAIADESNNFLSHNDTSLNLNISLSELKDDLNITVLNETLDDSEPSERGLLLLAMLMKKKKKAEMMAAGGLLGGLLGTSGLLSGLLGSNGLVGLLGPLLGNATSGLLGTTTGLLGNTAGGLLGPLTGLLGNPTGLLGNTAGGLLGNPTGLLGNTTGGLLGNPTGLVSNTAGGLLGTATGLLGNVAGGLLSDSDPNNVGTANSLNQPLSPSGGLQPQELEVLSQALAVLANNNRAPTELVTKPVNGLLGNTLSNPSAGLLSNTGGNLLNTNTGFLGSILADQSYNSPSNGNTFTGAYNSLAQPVHPSNTLQPQELEVLSQALAILASNSRANG